MVSQDDLHDRLCRMIGTKVEIWFLGRGDKSTWMGVILEVGRDFVRVEDPSDPCTIISLRSIARVSVSGPKGSE